MKSTVSIILLVSLVICGWVFLSLPFAPNVGLRIGYWGELNRSIAWLRARANLRIDDQSFNRDISLEEFSIRITVDDRHQATIGFNELPIARDRLLDSATHIVFKCFLKPGQGCGNFYQCARIVDLHPGNILEEKAGCDIRSVADVFDNFGAVISVVDTLPFANEKMLQNQWKLKSQTLYLSISCPSLGL